jgi:hypothetical protein
MAALALEIEHGVDHVLEHAGPAIAPSLVTWPTSSTGDAARLASSTSACAEARTWVTVPGRAVDGVEPHGLDRIDHRDLGRLGALEGGDDVAHRGGGGELHRRVAQAQPLGAQTHLVERLLAGDVGAGGVLPGQRRRDLQQKSGLADSRIAADQQRRADHQPAAADAIELGDAAFVARRLRRGAGQAGELEMPPLAAAGEPAGSRAGRGAPPPRRSLFHSPQLSQRPLHLLVTAPQLWQTKRLSGRAISAARAC